MNNPDSPEAVEARKNQSDPIVMYLIVRESLGMGVGKTAAQCAHASQKEQIIYNDLCDEMNKIAEESYRSSSEESEARYHSLWEPVRVFDEWLNSSFRKVVLKADEKEWAKLKEWAKESDERHVIIIDAGLTEIAAGSETVIALWPMYKSNVPKIIQKLQVLK